MNTRSKDQSSRSQGYKVHNVATRQPCGTVSLQLCRPMCRRATRRSCMAWPSRCATSQPCSTVLLKAIEWSASVLTLSSAKPPVNTIRNYKELKISCSMQMSMRKLNSHTILQNYPSWCWCHVGLMYKLLYPSIRVRTAPPVSVRVRVRVSFNFTV